MSSLTELIDPLLKIARDAGKGILEVYENEDLFHIELKSDESPLTAADKRSNDIICSQLLQLDPSYPIISEENKEVEFDKRKNYTRFWLIDPLDGTKEFIKRNGEFTVNIALIEDGRSILGVVYAPVLDKMYWAVKGKGAFIQEKEDSIQVFAQTKQFTDQNLRIVCSRSHLNDETQSFIDQFDDPVKVSKGSSLKFLIIANGNADIYPRLGPTMEWDTAAAQIILEEAGGRVIDEQTKAPLKYNKTSLRNPNFIAYGDIH